MAYQVQFTIPYVTNIPSDVVTNVFHFNWSGGGPPTDAQFDDLLDAIVDFYETCYNGGTVCSMAEYAAPALASAKIYDLDQPAPRIPVYSRGCPLTVQQDTSSLLPPEVAICVSYRAAAVSGTNPANRRGRIYMGVIGDTAVSTAASAFPEPTLGLRTGWAGASEALALATAAISFPWVVYSRQLDATYLITNGYVDNAFDTQRRRGQAATSRFTWSL